ncbi:Crp/Fnr family transcriptional regulator [Synechococcus sp. PCC 6312]|uniref:Crp/Fnr family transcriptional regulator n=1 Tax=Synechococcus sp. (strain ATCC 27167 / PCC 6312) TaxID=195253 RepID=UPI00029F2226|nr:Crp/Fnr family transcriptional regulator [Synechococcus sp. PCC 6312]AFY59885.1 cAMP-binding protein [Synechococcus sp. PCC 6312]
METGDFSKLFPLFDTGSAEALGGMLGVAWQNEYPANRAILIEDAWGNAVYFILEGWVKVRRLGSNQTEHTLAILGPGDFFGEMAILDEAPRSTDVVALTRAEIMAVPSQKFTQVLLREPKLNYRMLQLMAQRLRQTNSRIEAMTYPPAVKLANVLVGLGQRYGQPSGGMTATLCNVPAKDLADIASIGTEEAEKLMERFAAKGWLKVDPQAQTLNILNLSQLRQLIEQQILAAGHG